MTTKEKLKDIVLNNPHAPIREEGRIALINKVLQAAGADKEFRKKKPDLYGIHKTKEYDCNTMLHALYRFVMQLPYNEAIYDTLVIFGLLPRFHTDDLVKWKDIGRIDRITDVVVDLYGDIRYMTIEHNVLPNVTPKVGKAHESYLEYVGTAPQIVPKLLGKSEDVLDAVTTARIGKLMQECFSNIKLPEGCAIDCEPNGNWYCGYALGNISAYIRSTKEDWEADAHNGEIRFHLKPNSSGQWSTSIWWKFGSVYYGHHWDLFERYHSEPFVKRFVYGDTIGEAFMKSAEQINTVLNLLMQEKDEVLAGIKEGIAAKKGLKSA